MFSQKKSFSCISRSGTLNFSAQALKAKNPPEENFFYFRKRKPWQNVRNLFRLKTEIKGIKDIVLRIIKHGFEYEKEEKIYYKRVRLSNFCSNNYNECKSNDDILIKLDHI